MFSFRRDQFRAIFWGMVMADALSCQRLTLAVTSTQLWEPMEKGAPDPPISTIESNPWRPSIIANLRRLTDEEQIPLGLADSSYLEQAAIPQTYQFSNAIEAILFTLPQFLTHLDSPDSASQTWLGQVSPVWQAAVVSFYQATAALLNADILFAKQIHQQLQRNLSPNLEEEIIFTALEHVFLADGHFALTLGQSLNWPSSISGLPILSGLLSACWVGRQGLPIYLYQQLKSPSPTLQDWLQKRWQMNGTGIADAWAEVLWGQWLGKHSINVGNIESSSCAAVGSGI